MAKTSGKGYWMAKTYIPSLKLNFWRQVGAFWRQKVKKRNFGMKKLFQDRQFAEKSSNAA